MEGVFGGNWYQSAVKLEGKTIVPAPPFEPYNPFDQYYSSSQVRQGQISLYLEFLSVDSDKPEEVLNFCQRFGVLGSVDSIIPILSPSDSHLLAFAESVELISKKPRKDSLAEPFAAPRLWVQVADHVGKIKIQDPGKAQEVGELFGQLHRNSTRLDPTEICVPMEISEFRKAQSDLRDEVYQDLDQPYLQTRKDHTIGVINEQLFKAYVRPYLQWDIQRGQPRLDWESHTLLGILWMMMMLDFLGPGKILTCPRCSTLFMTASNRMKYCSPSCYGVHKVQKYQKKKKEELLAVKKGKKVKPRASTGKKQ